MRAPGKTENNTDMEDTEAQEERRSTDIGTAGKEKDGLQERNLSKQKNKDILHSYSTNNFESLIMR